MPSTQSQRKTLRRPRGLIVAATAVAATGSIVGASAATASASPSVVSSVTTVLHSCALAETGHVSCLAQLRAHRITLSNGTVHVNASSSTPAGYGPSDLRSAYKLPSTTAGSGQTVGIVDAYNDPTAASDLAVYRSQYGESACTTASGCLRIVNESGGSALPTTDTGWAQEESLDLDMASAIAPNAHILLVEASSTSDADLEAAENEAAKLGATEISNSYGGSEASSETSENSAYNHPGIAITASAGDSGYGVEFPAAVPSVTAVGGTSLTKASNARGWTETVWGSASSGFLGESVSGGTGSGCSAYEPKPSWQKDAGCTKRTVADVSADADPNTGVAVYDSTANEGQSGWLEFGGTSVSSPIIASVYALAGNAASTNAASYAYSHTSSLNDVTSGTNGSCGGYFGGGSAKKYLCTGEVGYDGPTGLGTPNGTGAF